jgi:hypothetical protein
MLTYFPTIYPGELLYSVLARYHQHIGMPGPMQLLETLFGSRKVIAAIDLQGHLQVLADRIPAERGFTVDRMIDTLTLCSYFIAFEPPSLQANVRRAMMRGAVENLHVRLGLAAFRVRRISRLRFCPECNRDMSANYGELYWRREHQLPSVLICPEHGRPLLESAIPLSQCSRHAFVAATPDNCSRHARPVVPAMDQFVMSHLHRLACLSVQLLENPPKPRTFAGWTAFYRSQMMETGLARSSGTMDQQRFDREFRDFYDHTLELLPNVMEGSEFAGDWLAAMVRKHRKAAHPLYHLLVQNFLAQRDQHVSPFGYGPWQCLNPLAHHRSPTPIKTVAQHRNHSKSVGFFSCFCGYVYTRCFDSETGRLGHPRFLRYGPLLEPALRRLVAASASLREISRTLHLDPKTVVRLAREIGITVSWTFAPSGRGRIAPAHVKTTTESPPGRESEPVRRQKKSDTPRRDWSAIDQAWVVRLNTLAHIIRKESPPVRITVAEIDRRAGRRGWLLKRRKRMPQTMDLLERTVESIEEFQVRRVDWVIRELQQECGAVKAWQVMRKAGLHSESLAWIKAALEATPATWNIAA